MIRAVSILDRSWIGIGSDRSVLILSELSLRPEMPYNYRDLGGAYSVLLFRFLNNFLFTNRIIKLLVTQLLYLILALY